MTSPTHSSPPTDRRPTPSPAGEHEAIWKALADSSRRHMLDLLRTSPQTTGELAAAFQFSRFATMKHLKVLQQAGLIWIERRGRQRINHLDPLPIQSIHRRWIKPFEQLPADRLLRLRAIAERTHTGGPE